MAARRRVPGYLHHRARNVAKVVIDGHTHYLPGEYNSDESKAAYDRLIAQHLTHQEHRLTANVTLNRLAVSYIEFARTFYLLDGEETKEVDAIRRALKVLLKRFGKEPVASFGPLKLKRVRQDMIDCGWYRRTINDHVSRIVRMLRWGVEEEWVPPVVFQMCREVRNLQAGRCGDVPEGKPVQPVSLESIAATLPHVTPQIAAMIQLQLLTGMRPGEVRIMRWQDIDVSDSEVWTYTPRRHKTQHHGRLRRIFIGPEGREILQQFREKESNEYIFCPRDASEHVFSRRRADRKSPMTPSQAARQRESAPDRGPGCMYTKDSYTRAITRACEIAFGMPAHLRRISSKLSPDEKAELRVAATEWRATYCWSPNQLRHTAATQIRKVFGLNSARQILGHSEKRTTEIYAEEDFEAAREIMKQVG